MPRNKFLREIYSLQREQLSLLELDHVYIEFACLHHPLHHKSNDKTYLVQRYTH